MVGLWAASNTSSNSIQFDRAAISQTMSQDVFQLRLGDMQRNGQPFARRGRLAQSDRWLAPTASKMSPLSGLCNPLQRWIATIVGLTLP